MPKAYKREFDGKVARSVFFGFLGGLVAVLIKCYLRDYTAIAQMYDLEHSSGTLFGYALAGLGTSLVGGVGAWLSELKSKRHLLFVGWVVAGILSAMSPELEAPDPETKQGSLLRHLSPITYAYAENGDRECVGDDAIVRGFKLFFGIQEKFDRYRVVVASKKGFEEAAAKAKSINSEHPSLKARVAARKCGNDFYPIVIGEDLPIREAKKLLDEARAIESEAYLSPVPRKKN